MASSHGISERHLFIQYLITTIPNWLPHNYRWRGNEGAVHEAGLVTTAACNWSIRKSHGPMASLAVCDGYEKDVDIFLIKILSSLKKVNTAIVSVS